MKSKSGILLLLSTLALSPPVLAGEMAGGTQRVTRDDVNAGGGLLSGTGFLLQGAAGGEETVLMAGGAFQAQSGLMKIMDYPTAVTSLSLQPDPADFSKLRAQWNAPAAEATLDKPAASYIMRYSSV